MPAGSRSCRVPGEYICRSACNCTIIRLVTVYTFCTAGFFRCAYDERVAREGHTIAEIIVGIDIRCLDIRLLGPGRACPSEHVHRSAPIGTVVSLVAITAGLPG